MRNFFLKPFSASLVGHPFRICFFRVDFIFVSFPSNLSPVAGGKLHSRWEKISPDVCLAGPRHSCSPCFTHACSQSEQLVFVRSAMSCPDSAIIARHTQRHMIALVASVRDRTHNTSSCNGRGRLTETFRCKERKKRLVENRLNESKPRPLGSLVGLLSCRRWWPSMLGMPTPSLSAERNGRQVVGPHRHKGFFM